MSCFKSTQPTAPKTSITTYKQRSCTDKLFLVLSIVFICTLIIMVYIPALSAGDWKFDKPSRIIYPHDWKGNRCPNVAWWPHSKFGSHSDAKDTLRINRRYKECLDECKPTFKNYGGYCLPQIQNEKYQKGVQYYESKEKFYKWQSATGCGMRDIIHAKKVIAASVGITICVIFVFMVFVKLMITPLVYGCILCIVAALGTLSIAFMQRSLYLADYDTEARNWKYFIRVCAILIAIFDFVFIAIMYKMRNQIKISVEIIKSSIRVIEDVKLILLFPVLSILVQLFFLIVWIYFALYLFATSDMKNIPFPRATNKHGCYQVLDYAKTAKTTFLPHFFLFFWTTCFIQYCSFCIISGVIADWYFTPRHYKNGRKLRCDKKSTVYDDSVHLSTTPIIDSICRTMRYHIGTIAFAASFISIVRFIRFVVWKLINFMDGGLQPNQAQIACKALVHCLLRLLDCCLDKMSKNALIYNAIYGDAFCASVNGSFQLIWSNLVRAAHVSLMTRMVIRLGKLMIILVTVSICAMIFFEEPYHSELSSPVLPLIVIGILSFIISKLCLAVYVTAVDTVFVCFLVDEKCNRYGGSMLADPGLREVISKNEAAAKQAVKENATFRERNLCFDNN